VRAADAEEALVAAGSTADLTDVGRLASAHLSPIDDLHATAAYRTAVAAVVVRQALAAALGEAAA